MRFWDNLNAAKAAKQRRKIYETDLQGLLDLLDGEKELARAAGIVSEVGGFGRTSVGQLAVAENQIAYFGSLTFTDGQIQEYPVSYSKPYVPTMTFFRGHIFSTLALRRDHGFFWGSAQDLEPIVNAVEKADPTCIEIVDETYPSINAGHELAALVLLNLMGLLDEEKTERSRRSILRNSDLLYNMKRWEK